MENSNTANKYVVFKIEQEFYGIDISKVKSIERIQHFTRVPNAPPFVKGVINLRGEVVPIIDFRLRINIDYKEIDLDSRIIIVNVDEIQVGLLVDSSSEVIEIGSDNIDNPPMEKEGVAENFVEGIGKLDGKLIILINVESLIKTKEVETIS